MQRVSPVADHPAGNAVQLQIQLPDLVRVQFDQELLGHPLFTGMDQAAIGVVAVAVEAGSDADRPAQGHLKIVPILLNSHNAEAAIGYLPSPA